MSFTVTATFSTLAEAVAFLTASPSAGNTTATLAATFPPITGSGVGADEKAAVLDKPVKPKVEKAAPTPPPAVVETKAAETKADTTDYPTLQKAVFALAGKSRDAASACAQSFGVKTFKELDPSKWGEALAAVKAATAELEEAVA